MKTILLAAALALGTNVALGTAAGAGELNVRIDGIEAVAGNLFVAVQTEAQFLTKDGVYTRIAPVAGSVTDLQFVDVAPGRYAVAAVYDADGDGDFGLGDSGPDEPWGVSGAAAEGGAAANGAPRFADHAVEVSPQGTAFATVTLRAPR